MSTRYKLWFTSYVSEPTFMFYGISVHFKVYMDMFNENMYRLNVPLKYGETVPSKNLLH